MDPTHGTGRKSLIAPMALAGIAAGAQGIMIEVHPKPNEALSDKEQALDPGEFKELADSILKLKLFVSGGLNGTR